MRTLDEIIDDGEKRAAFSNGFEWDRWSSAWCQRCRHDVNEDCPLVSVAVLLDVTPKEWVTNDERGLETRYNCTEFEELVNP